MSIIQDLYNIYDKEQAKYRARQSSKSGLILEMQRNLAFLREGLREDLGQDAMVKGLEDAQFTAAGKQGLNLNSLQKKKLEASTYGGIQEFDRYRNWQTARLIETSYERIATLKKLVAGSSTVDLKIRLRNLFKLLMIVTAHLQGQKLTPVKKSKF